MVDFNRNLLFLRHPFAGSMLVFRCVPHHDSGQIAKLQYITKPDFPEIRKFPLLNHHLRWGRYNSDSRKSSDYLFTNELPPPKIPPNCRQLVLGFHTVKHWASWDTPGFRIQAAEQLATKWGPLTAISGFIPSYTHLQPWLNRVCWSYNYLITRGTSSCKRISNSQHFVIPVIHGPCDSITTVCHRTESWPTTQFEKNICGHRYFWWKWGHLVLFFFHFWLRQS